MDLINYTQDAEDNLDALESALTTAANRPNRITDGQGRTLYWELKYELRAIQKRLRFLGHAVGTYQREYLVKTADCTKCNGTGIDPTDDLPDVEKRRLCPGCK